MSSTYDEDTKLKLKLTFIDAIAISYMDLLEIFSGLAVGITYYRRLFVLIVCFNGFGS